MDLKDLEGQVDSANKGREEAIKQLRKLQVGRTTQPLWSSPLFPGGGSRCIWGTAPVLPHWSQKMGLSAEGGGSLGNTRASPESGRGQEEGLTL